MDARNPSFAKQQSCYHSLQILWLFKVENARDNSTNWEGKKLVKEKYVIINNI